MTTKDYFKSLLVQRGMFESQADEVMKIFIEKTDRINNGYQMTWDRPKDEYPDALYNVMWSTLKWVALTWIDEHIPQAWFREMFV